MKKIYITGLVLILFACLGYFLNRISTRSDVSDKQVSEMLPGDDVFPHPWTSIDRAAKLPVSAAVAWPWVAQLGSERGGWYAPMWLQDTLNKHAATTTLPQFQNLTVGEQIPDFGGGALRVLAVVPGQYIEYGSIPNITSTTTEYNFTWTLVLEESTASNATFHLRLRIPQPTHYRYLPASLPGLIDYATDEVMFAGLKEQLREK